MVPRKMGQREYYVYRVTYDYFFWVHDALFEIHDEYSGFRIGFTAAGPVRAHIDKDNTNNFG